MQTAQLKTEPLSAHEQASDFARLANMPHRASLETYVNASPEPVKAIEQFGKWIAKCGMFKCTREEQGMIIAIACIEMRIGLIEFGQTYDVMHDGRLRKQALAAQVHFQNLGGKVRWLDCGENRDKAEAEFEFNGEKRVFKFTMEEAKRAGKGSGKAGDVWDGWTSDMLCARVLSRGIKRVCPQVYAGFGSDDDEADSVPALILPKSEVIEPAPAPVNRISRECASESIAKTPVVSEFGNTTSSPPVTSAVVTGGQPRPADNPDEKAEAAAGLAPVAADPKGYRISEEMAKQLDVALKDCIPASVDYLIKIGKITREQAASGDTFRYVPESFFKDLFSSQKRLAMFIKYATAK